MLQRGFGSFNKYFGKTTDGFVHLSRILIHKSLSPCSALILVGIVAVYLGNSLPGGFIPTEDQGYMFLASSFPMALRRSAPTPRNRKSAMPC